MSRRLQIDPLQQQAPTADSLVCFHCGDECSDDSIHLGEKLFCCNGCKTVYEILHANELCDYYDLDSQPGLSPQETHIADRFGYLDDEAVIQKLIEFSDGKHNRVTLNTPGMHCSSCIWLLEKLHNLDNRITRSSVNFPRKQVTITYHSEEMTLSEVAALLASLGYEPLISLDSLETRETTRAQRTLWIKIGMAGFAFGNVMLLSFPEYLSRSGEVDPLFRQVFGYLNLLLSLPVLLYSSTDYFKSAWAGLKQKVINIDVPISLGVGILFLRSSWEILTQTGAGYFDSFTGLVFFLLVGRIFQQKTYDALSFERDYRAYFPLSVTRLIDAQEISIPVSKLKPGDRILVRNQELVPADSVLLKSGALIDYSFVTGESDPVSKSEGDFIYAGGRQVGTAIELEVIKEPSQSYLTSLWNNEEFQKPRHSKITSAVNRVSKYFTLAVLLIAGSAGGFWLTHDVTMAMRVFTAVLIVACPCALALASPFALGTAMRLLGRLGFYIKDTESVESLAGIDTIVLDKTGTLTEPNREQILFEGATLTQDEQTWVKSLVRHSTHPLSQKIYTVLESAAVHNVDDYREHTGAGLSGSVDGHTLRLGSHRWLGVESDTATDTLGTRVFLEIDGAMKGSFGLRSSYRKGLRDLINQLQNRFELYVLSGDSDRERATLVNLFGDETHLAFQQSPEDKLSFVRNLREQGRHVLMVGDGLNDAGALRASEVGIAVTEDISAFSPASDAILDGSGLTRLVRYLKLSRQTRHIILASFVISILYNVVGISFAVAGLLSPLVSAILMPVSSISVVAFTTFSTSLAAHRLGLGASH